MKRWAALGPGLLVAILAGACGSTPERAEREPVVLESFAELTAAAVCTLAFQCCSESGRADLPEAEPECRTRLAADLNQELLPPIEAAVAAGQLRYHAEGYEVCLRRVVSEGCATASAYIDCLSEGLVPLVREGGTCRAHAHCMNGSCIGATSTVAGVCGEPLADGLDCGSPLECASGACINRVCTVPIVEGHSCYADSDCASKRCDPIAHVCGRPSRAMCD